MEEGFTMLYVGWLLIKVCLVIWTCLFLIPPKGKRAAAHH